VVSHDRDFLDRVASAVVLAEGDGRWTEYAGGYTDMVNQRGHGIGGGTPEAASAKPAKKAVKGPANGEPAKRKLTFKEKYALENLPKQIAELRRKTATLRKKLDDPDLYRRDPKTFKKASADFAAAEAEIARAENEWLEMELLRETIEG
jgi:ATP-binding cassette subfamily F protein uup